MSDFVGRTLELDRLTRLLAEISTRATAGRTHDVGTAVLLRGRRRVGKQEFVYDRQPAGIGKRGVDHRPPHRPVIPLSNH